MSGSPPDETPDAPQHAPDIGARGPTVELHIAELALYGFAPGDRYRIGEAAQAELARLFAERGAPAALLAGGEIGQLDGGAFQVASGARAEVIGAQIAQAVYGGLGR